MEKMVFCKKYPDGNEFYRVDGHCFVAPKCETCERFFEIKPNNLGMIAGELCKISEKMDKILEYLQNIQKK